jgi:hypothetical protein
MTDEPKPEVPEPARGFAPRDRVSFSEVRGAVKVLNLGTVVRVSINGYLHIEWDDHSEGWFSPAMAASSLRLAQGDDALPRHLWIFDVPVRLSQGWEGPLPTLDEPICAVCREPQTDDNEFGPCRKQAVA